MPRENSPYIVGDYWLDKRRDGRTPDTWQITTYDRARRAVVYRSAHTSSLEEAKAAIHAHAERQRAKRPQAQEEAGVAMLLILYWEERGRNVISPDQIASSIRQFLAFMLQDEIGATAVVADLTNTVFERFRVWRMAPHSYAIPWQGKTYSHASKGVNGESVQRNIDDIRAALLHHEREGRITAPRIRNVEKRHRSTPRDRVLTADEIVSIVGYAKHDPGLYRFVALMLATAVRPEAALAFDPANQWHGELIDLHPKAWERSKKVNPVVLAIPELIPVLKDWSGSPVKSRKTAWRKMRQVLGLPGDVQPKTIRHSVATWLHAFPDLPPHLIEMLLGHTVLKTTTAGYAKAVATTLAPLKAPLSTIWRWVHHGAEQWSAVHMLSTPKRGEPIKLIDKSANAAVNIDL